MDLSIIAMIISITLGVISLGAVVWRGGGMARDVATLMKCKESCGMTAILVDIASIKKQQEVFWTVIQPHLAAIIHSPTHKRRDELVDKLITDQIGFDELVELEPMLHQEANNGVAEKRLPAALLSARVQILLTRGP
jgi:hypothetical protein